MDLLKQLKAGPRIKELTPEVYNDSINISIPFFILYKKIFESGDELLAGQYKLNQSQFDVLTVLFYLSDDTFTLSPTQLYEKLLFSSGGMTKILNKLENMQLITRVENKDDKRSKLVQITQLGKDVTREAFKKLLKIEEEYFSKLNNDEQKKLKELLEKMIL